MTVSPSAGTVATAGQWDSAITGFENFESTEMQIPRLSLSKPAGGYKHSITGDVYTELEIIALLPVRQRTMWVTPFDPNAEDKSPQCRSNNFRVGFPNMLSKDPDNHFPFDESPDFDQPLGQSENGLATLPCGDCKFKEWGKNPKNPKKRVPPRCGEVITFPIYFRDPADGPDAEWEPAIISFSSSAITPSKNFIQPFFQKNKPMYSSIALMEFDMRTNGTNDYYVPKFKVIGPSPEGMFAELVQSATEMNEMLQQDPAARDSDGNVVQSTAPVNNDNTPATSQVIEPEPVAATPPAEPAPTPAAAPPAPTPPVAPAAPTPAPEPAAAPAPQNAPEPQPATVPVTSEQVAKKPLPF